MAIKKPATATQLRQAKVEIANLQVRNESLYGQWTKEVTELNRVKRELAIASARCMKLKGIIEYLEDQAKNKDEK
jgi:hypothetical protein